MMCGNGTIATPHPSELFGSDWMEWGRQSRPEAKPAEGEVPAES
jgi:hypothetical protein